MSSFLVAQLANDSLFETAVEACAWGILIQRNERLVYANRAALDCLKLRAQDVARTALAELFDPESYETLRPNLQKMAPDDDQLFMADLRLRRSDGSLIEAEVHHMGMTSHSGGETLINFRDVTLFRRMEIELRQAQKLESIGRLAAGIAHEINTPIQFIGDSAHYLENVLADMLSLLRRSRAELRQLAADDPSWLERLAEEEDAADLEFTAMQAPGAIARIGDGVSRVSRIVLALKSFSHPGSESPAPVDINKVLTDTLIIAGHHMRGVLDVSTELETLPPFDGYEGDLGQAFLNLIVNAVHAVVDRSSQSAAGKIVVSTRAESDHIVIRVTDNGCGMTPEVQARLFEPFFTTKEIGRGTGQGLNIVRTSIVQKHHGKIDVTSTVGIGTTFTLRLPLQAPAPPR